MQAHDCPTEHHKEGGDQGDCQQHWQDTTVIGAVSLETAKSEGKGAAGAGRTRQAGRRGGWVNEE